MIPFVLNQVFILGNRSIRIGLNLNLNFEKESILFWGTFLDATVSGTRPKAVP